VTDIAWCNY